LDTAYSAGFLIRARSTSAFCPITSAGSPETGNSYERAAAVSRKAEVCSRVSAGKPASRLESEVRGFTLVRRGCGGRNGLGFAHRGTTAPFGHGSDGWLRSSRRERSLPGVKAKQPGMGLRPVPGLPRGAQPVFRPFGLAG
jgi:hypothetical protein